jgi:pyrimidine deaminase RibD-like protein
VIVKDGQVLAESANKVAQTNDPTAHAEILAIREACLKLGTEHLVDATIYVMAHPCPMCLGSLYYCSPKEVIFGDHTRVVRAVLPRRQQILRGLVVLRRIRQKLGPAAPADALRTARPRGGCLPVVERAQRRPAQIHCHPAD